VSASVVLGLDIGGTWTRALLVGVPDGARIDTARRAGGNPTTYGVDAAAMHIEAAIAEALAAADLDATAVSACVVGMAGASKLAGDPAAADAIAALWRRVGLRCPVEIVADVTAAFAAGSAEPDGSILLAGTGAVAATMRDRRPVGILGGHGWLLGDEGSGFWIGRQAVRATLRDLDDGVTPSGLAAAVLAELVPASGGTSAPAVSAAPNRPDFGLGEGRRLAAAVIAAANARRPVHLAGLVPLVLTAAEQGDHNAAHILHEAADLLVATLAHARDVGGTREVRGTQDPTAPIVLAGGILAPGSPVQRLVLAAIAETWPKATVTAGVDGTAGAAWLAAHHVLGDGLDAAALHTRLLREHRISDRPRDASRAIGR
jgi:glucosamine kinase